REALVEGDEGVEPAAPEVQLRRLGSALRSRRPGRASSRDRLGLQVGARASPRGKRCECQRNASETVIMAVHASCNCLPLLASPGRLELPTLRLGGECSIHLSYGDARKAEDWPSARRAQ